jgi:hypothetical protein
MAGPYHRFHGAIRVAPLPESPEGVDDHTVLLEAAVPVQAQGDEACDEHRDHEGQQRHPAVAGSTWGGPTKRKLIFAKTVAELHAESQVGH